MVASPSPTSPSPEDKDRSWAQWTGAGFEFAASVLLFFFLGTWADATWGTQPWMTVAGALLGVVVGMYLLIRQALEHHCVGDETRIGAHHSVDIGPNVDFVGIA